jgi:hypothetical protein
MAAPIIHYLGARKTSGGQDRGRNSRASLHLPDCPRHDSGAHPSRQNTNTGKLMPAMMASVFKKAKRPLR